LVAKALKEKRLSANIELMVKNIECVLEICSEWPEKYI
jgi:hypothetical protein